MDFTYDGCRLIGVNDPYATNRYQAHTAEAMGAQAYEAMGKFEEIPIVKIFMWPAAQADDALALDQFGEKVLRGLAEKIEAQRNEIPAQPSLLTAQPTEPTQGPESAQNRAYSAEVDAGQGMPAEMAVLAFFRIQIGEPEMVKHWPYGKYDVDIRVMLSGQPIFIDVESRAGVWDGETWPGRFPTVHVPARKTDMMHKRKPFFYYITNKENTRALVLRGVNILDSITTIINDEPFWDVPREKIVRYVDL